MAPADVRLFLAAVSWQGPIEVGSAEIVGDLMANLQARKVVSLKAGARFFGELKAGGLAMEDGAVLVGPVEVRPG